MRWWRHRKKETPDMRDSASYDAACERLEELERRADKVVPALDARRRRNSWGEVIADIARKG